MEGTFTSCLPDSPFRVPAWRWTLASGLHARGKRTCLPINDKWVGRAKHFLAMTDSRDGGQARGTPSRRDPALRGALDLSREEPPHRRWRVEALLLTDLPLEEVAR